MYSKFDIQINCEEVSNYEPTPADWEEYHNWLQEIEGDDSIGELSTDDSLDLTLEPIEDDDSIEDRWEDGFDDLRDDEYYENYDFGGSTYDDE